MQEQQLHLLMLLILHTLNHEVESIQSISIGRSGLKDKKERNEVLIDAPWFLIGASVKARISLIKLEFSSCLFADSLMNLLRISAQLGRSARASPRLTPFTFPSPLDNYRATHNTTLIAVCSAIAALFSGPLSLPVFFLTPGPGIPLIDLIVLVSQLNPSGYDRYAVSNGSGYAVLICWDEYAVLDKEMDTPYSVELDTPYSTVDQNSVDPHGFEGYLKMVVEVPDSS
ncbi:hypothetical protein Tco_1301155 [Tanacetum coccineum]